MNIFDPDILSNPTFKIQMENLIKYLKDSSISST